LHFGFVLQALIFFFSEIILQDMSQKTVSFSA